VASVLCRPCVSIGAVSNGSCAAHILRLSYLRYVRLFLDLAQYWGYTRLQPFRSRDPKKAPSTRQATIITITLGTEPAYDRTIRAWLQNDPGAIIVATVDQMVPSLERLVREINDSRVTVVSAKEPSARAQYYEAIRRVDTPYFVMTDDRSLWSHTMLYRILSPFEDPAVGGVNTLQLVTPAKNGRMTVWESFGALNLVRRNVQHSALAYFHDGQVLNLSGRLSAYRTRIFQHEAFYDQLLHETWLGRYLIKTGDDNTLTNWILRDGWKTSFESTKDAILLTRVCPDSLYLRQLLRWQRDTIRWYMSDLWFGLRNPPKRHLTRAVLNIGTYYFTDVTTLAEVLFLVLFYACGPSYCPNGSQVLNK
jgi:hypothetical protein